MKLKIKPCPFCEKSFDSEKELRKHIRSVKYGHGKEICSNCKKTLKYCKDIEGVGAAFVC